MEQPKEKSGKFYIWQGLSFGLIMYITTEFITPLANKEAISTRSMIISFPIWIVMGIGFGLINKRLAKRNKD